MFVSSEIAFGLSTLCIWGFSDFLVKIPVSRCGWKVTLVWIQLVGVLSLLIFSPILGNPFSIAPELILGIVIAGAINYGGYSALYRAIDIGPVGIVAAVNYLFPVVSVFLGWLLLREHLSFLQCVGACLGITSIFLLSLPPKGVSKKLRQSSVVLAAISAFFFGVSLFLVGFFAQKTSWYHATFFLRLGTLLFSLFRFSNERIIKNNIAKNNFGILALVGLIEVLGLVTYNMGASSGRISVITILVGLAPAVTTTLAWLFYKERLIKKDIVALAGTLLAGVLISF